MDLDSLKQLAKDTGKRILKSLLKTGIGRKVIIVACIVAIILFVGALKIIKHIDTAGNGDEIAKVPEAVHAVLDDVGVSTSVNSTSSGASGNFNMIDSYAESGDGYSSITKVGDKTYRNYKQYEGSYSGDYYWGSSIAGAACGPTSVTIVLSAYKMDYSPRDVVKRMINEVADFTDSYNLSKLLNLYGIDNERRSYDGSASLNAIRQNLSEGRPVIVGIDGADGIYSSGGHWMVLLGEKDGHLIVSNPGRSDSSTASATANETLENFLQKQLSMGNGYILIKKELNSVNTQNNYGEISNKLVKAAQECHKYLRENNYIYKKVGLEIPDGIYGQNTIDCSSYVSWVYYTAGYNTFKAGQENAFVDNYEKHNLKQVAQKDAKPGDIIVYSGHVEILAEIKNGQITKVYNCGGNDSIQSTGLDGLPESSNPSTGYNGQPKMILRPKELSSSENPIKGGSSSSSTIAENKIFFIGDSWMYGLRQINIAKSPSTYFYAERGMNADWVLDTYEEMKKQMPKDASCIVVEFGLNGLTNWAKTQELVDKLLKDYSNKPIFVLKTPHICDGYTVAPDFNKGVDQYNENMEKYCSGKNGVNFIDPTINIVSEEGKGYLKQEYAQNFNDTSMGGGKIHLNNKGYEVWYKDIINLIQGTASSSGQYGGGSSTNISGHIVENGRGGYKADIDLDKKADEIIKKFEEEDVKDLKNYLTDKNRKEYLKSFIHAAIVTSYPDLRNISEYGKEVPEGEVQGIIKLKRKTKDMDENDGGYYLQYIPLEQYEKLKEKKDNSIFNYFTVSKSGEFVVAGYEKVTAEPQKVDTGGDPRPDEVEDKSEKSRYDITDSRINYAQQVERYAMPFDLLWTLLVYSGEEDFVNDLAKLVINSEIIITVCDNITYTDTEDVYTYVKNVKTKENTTFEDITQNPPKTSSENQVKKYSAYIPEKHYNYKITNVTHYESNNPSIEITYADTWAMKYEAKVIKDSNSNTDTTESKEDDDEKYQENGKENVDGSKISNLNSWKKDYKRILDEAYSQDINDTNEAIEKQKEEIEKAKKLKEEREKQKEEEAKAKAKQTQNQQTNQTQNQQTNQAQKANQNNTKNEISDDQLQAIIDQKPIEEFKTHYQYYYTILEYEEKLTNKNRTVTTKTTEYTYETEPGKTTGKDDPDSDEESFVKLLKKHKGAEKSLKELVLWFFESVEDQESICDMEDLLKYLFQKEMGIDLGVEDFDFDAYGRGNYSVFGDVDILTQFICRQENNNLWEFLYENGSYNALYVSTHVSKDKQYFYMRPDDYKGGDIEHLMSNRNYGFGICIGGSGSYNHEVYFNNYGYDLRKLDEYVNQLFANKISLKKFDELTKVRTSDVVQIKNEIIQERTDFVESYLAQYLPEYNLTQYQKHVLIDIAYQYGNIDGFSSIFKSNYHNGKINYENIFASFHGFHVDEWTGDYRVHTRRALFKEGIYSYLGSDNQYHEITSKSKKKNDEENKNNKNSNEVTNEEKNVNDQTASNTADL